MDSSFEHIDHLVIKSLAGEATKVELAELAAWSAESTANETYVADAKKLFAAIDSSQTQLYVNVDAAWKKLDERISTGETKIIPLNRKVFSWRAVAAVALLVALTVIFKLYVIKPEVKSEVFAATKTALEKKLPDGSKVFINKNSELSYTHKAGKVREVKLKGEAFFEVIHNEEEPFVISVDEVMIKDIGTAFNVKANPGSKLVEVLVESGEVQFYSSSSEGLLLVKGEKAVYNRETKEFKKSFINPLENVTSYKSKMFEFKGNTLNEVLAQINDVYASNIQLSNTKLGNCRLSVVFNNEDLETIVAIIAETMGLAIERKGNVIVLRGENCSEQ